MATDREKANAFCSVGVWKRSRDSPDTDLGALDRGRVTAVDMENDYIFCIRRVSP